MMSKDYDAIVVGARCGGSPTAMLLARLGYRVLLVDKATFPSDTMSTHLAHPPAVAALERWGILGRLETTGCPPIKRYSFNFGPVTISGTPRPTNGATHAYGPRRIVLDALLVDAAVAAGVEMREALRRRGAPRRRRAGHRHSRPLKGQLDGHRPGPRGDRGRRQALARREGGASRALQRDPEAGSRPTTRTGATCPPTRSTRSSALNRIAAGRPSRRTTTSRAWWSAGRSRSSTPTARTWRAAT